MAVTDLLLVCAGGAIGAGARYLVGVGAVQWFGAGYPWGTLAVNVVGSFFMGLAAHWMVMHAGLPVAARLFVMTGVLGGFTTFSAYALEIVTMVENGDWLLAASYAGVSVAGSVGALLVGLALARELAT